MSFFALAALAACRPRPPVVARPVAAPVVKRLVVTGAGAALERVTSEPVSERSPAISPDGRVLLFCVQTYDDVGELQQSTLVGVEPNTRAQRTLFTSTSSSSDRPAWIPDQSSYVYSSNSPGAWSLVRALTAAPNAAINVIASGEIAPGASYPALSPDGKRVAFVTMVRDVPTVAIIGIDGSQLTLLGDGWSPAFSPDGTTLAFVRAVGSHLQLFLLNPRTGTDLVQLTAGDWDHFEPSFSPDGQYVVFATNRGWNRFPEGSPKRIKNLYILKRDGTGLTQLTDGNSLSAEPNWGADGWVYFSSDQTGDSDIWRLRPEGEYASLQRAQIAPQVAAAAAPQPPAAAATPAGPAPRSAGSGCNKDTDCKGDRICTNGHCVSP